MSDRESWRILQQSDRMIAWSDLWSGEIVVIAKPEGYDYWNIYDSSDRAVEGHSLGPFRDYKDAKDRLREDIPEIPE